MAEYAEITEDPFTNKTGRYYVVLGIKSANTPPVATGWNNATSGVLADPAGNDVSYYRIILLYESSLASGPLASVSAAHEKMVVPPNYSLSSFGIAYGFFVTIEELPSWL